MTITICRVQHNLPNAIYVGRKMFTYTPRRGLVLPFALLSQIRYGSVLANPFRVGETPDPIGAFATLLEQRISRQNPLICTELLRITRLAERGDVTLACWCANAPRAWYADPGQHRDGCHADVIAGVIAKMVAAEQIAI